MFVIHKDEVHCGGVMRGYVDHLILFIGKKSCFVQDSPPQGKRIKRGMWEAYAYGEGMKEDRVVITPASSI